MSYRVRLIRKAVLAGIAALALGGCGPAPSGTDPDTGLTTDTGTGWVSSGYPLWIYQNFLAADELEYRDLEGNRVVRIDGYAWSGDALGPTLIAEVEQEILFTVTNKVSEAFDFEFTGVEVVNNPTVPGGGAVGTQTNLVVRSTLGPGVYPYRASTGGEDQSRRGMLGLIAVRDPAEFPVEDIEEQASIVMVDLPLDEVEVDACALYPESATGDCTPGTDGALPESWEPAPEGYNTVLLAQALRVNPQQRRHGGPPNEFISTVVGSSQRLYFDLGADARVNLFSESDATHTLSFGGLTWTDPATGEARDRVVLEPGQGTHVLMQGISTPGEFLVECLDHDHHGLGGIHIVVD